LSTKIEAPSTNSHFNQNCRLTFALLRALPHVRYWCDNYFEKYVVVESAIFWPRPTCADFVDALKEKYHYVGNYYDQYMRWTTVHQERDQTVLEYTNIFHTLHKNIGIKDSK
jgi:hypothetical protein